MNKIWALVRLRYRLIWAHARTGSGKIALLFALYLLGGMFVLLLSVGGFGAAIGAIGLGRGESIARWMLASLFANGIGLSLLFGLGLRAAFSEEALRRYPMDWKERFMVRHMIALLDPTWLILVAGAFGLTFGFAWLGAGSLITGIPAALLFIAANYLATAVLLSVIGWLMETRAGAALLGSAVILMVAFGPLMVASLVTTGQVAVWRMLDQILQLTPPGVAAAMIASDEPLKVIGGAGLLVTWCVVLVFALRVLENRPQVHQSATVGSIVWNNFYDQFSDLFGRKYGPLVSKSLRYHLRCNLIRFSLLTSPVVVLMGQVLLKRQGPNSFFLISLAIFFIMSSATGAALMLNLFGYDEAGIRRYAILPVSFADALRAGSLASLLLRAVTVFVAFALWLTFYNNESVTWWMLVMVLGVALSSLFLFNALGLWTSIFSPKNSDFDAMWNNRLSFGANLVVVGGILIPFWGAMFLLGRIGTISYQRFWWAPCLLLVVCVGFYAFSLRAIDGPIRARREQLIKLIAGARDK